MTKPPYDRDALPPDLQEMLPVRPAWPPAQKNEIALTCRTKPKSYEILKSCAQVAASVGQQVVGQMSGGLKPNESKPFKITARFSEDEREILVRQAENHGLTISEYIRASVLGPGYASSIDPVKRQLLQDLNRELGRQGNNLNQIAKHLNAGTATPAQGESMLGIIGRSLLSAHMRVARALAEGRRYE